MYEKRNYDSQGTVIPFGSDIPAGGAEGRRLRLEHQILAGRSWARLRVMMGDYESAKIWFSPSALGPLIENLESLKAALELEAEREKPQG